MGIQSFDRALQAWLAQDERQAARQAPRPLSPRLPLAQQIAMVGQRTSRGKAPGADATSRVRTQNTAREGSCEQMPLDL